MKGVHIISFNGKYPKVHPSAWIAPGCSIIGDVEIGPNASIWYNCVLRGDVNAIRIGAGANVQDGCIIHCDSEGGAGPGYPTMVGEHVLVGHSATIHGTTLERGCFVGIGAITMDGSLVESGGMLAAGGMLTPRKRIPAGELWGGSPAKLMRALSADEMKRNLIAVDHYKALAESHRRASEAPVCVGVSAAST